MYCDVWAAELHSLFLGQDRLLGVGRLEEY